MSSWTCFIDDALALCDWRLLKYAFADEICPCASEPSIETSWLTSPCIRVASPEGNAVVFIPSRSWSCVLSSDGSAMSESSDVTLGIRFSNTFTAFASSLKTFLPFFESNVFASLFQRLSAVLFCTCTAALSSFFTTSLLVTPDSRPWMLDAIPFFCPCNSATLRIALSELWRLFVSPEYVAVTVTWPEVDVVSVTEHLPVLSSVHELDESVPDDVPIDTVPDGE